MGGTIKKNVYSDKVHMLDLQTGVWYDAGIAIPKERRDFMKCVLVGHVAYFLVVNTRLQCGRLEVMIWRQVAGMTYVI